MESKKQSSIDWLFEQIKSNIDAEDGSMNMNWLYDGTFEQAKEMHKKEIEEAYNDGWHENNHEKYNPKQYYNETFGGDNEE